MFIARLNTLENFINAIKIFHAFAAVFVYDKMLELRADIIRALMLKALSDIISDNFYIFIINVHNKKSEEYRRHLFKLLDLHFPVYQRLYQIKEFGKVGRVIVLLYGRVV